MVRLSSRCRWPSSTHTHSALAVAALLVTGQALPAFARPRRRRTGRGVPRRGVLSGLYLFEAVATAALAVLLLWHFWLPAILLLVALDGTAALAASALLRAEAARAAREQVEARAGSAAQAAEGVEDAVARGRAKGERGAQRRLLRHVRARAGARRRGGRRGGAPAALFIDAASFLICGAMLLDLHPHVEEAGETSVRARLRAAWQHINEVPALRDLLLAEAVALVFFESAGPIEVAYAKVTLHAGDRGYGLLLGVWGVGVVVGKSCLRALAPAAAGRDAERRHARGRARLHRLRGRAIAAVACVAALIGGVGNGVEWASLISLVQRLTPQPLHGRLMGAVESLGALWLAVGLPLGGALVALSSPRAAFLVVGLGATAASVALFRVTREDLNQGWTPRSAFPRQRVL